MAKKLSTQQFIEKAIRVHGNKYDYSKVSYKNAHINVIIICPYHGEFWQEPTNHTHGGKGCPICAKGGTDEERYWGFVDKSGKQVEYVEGRCWRWLGKKNHNGYGRFWVNNETMPAHKFSYELHTGPVKEGLLVLHKCDNPECTNPQHLFIGTQVDNMADMSQKGRRRNQSGEKNNMAIITRDDVIEIRELYKSGRFTQKEIARVKGLALSTTNQIINYKRWKDV